MRFFFKVFIYLFLERGEGREKERERNISVWLPLMHPLLGTWPVTQACALTRESNQRPSGLQAGAQSTEPHQPGLHIYMHTYIHTYIYTYIYVCVYIYNFKLYFIDYAVKVVTIFSLSPLYPALPLPQAIPPPLFMSMGHVCKFLGSPISYTVLYIPMAIL